ncbi:hypothetical protein HWB05_gp078 [Streptomyces phage BRock]|uniref:Uncharacterized protein n=1 Tax=Streptomyces phage BRock TaxID=1913591 RepID=A0A1J0GVY6_9CAUD|nr:hypothetical protein HWB05_gp078 [Streptomyces phage BRock]APC46340.1 hypothetical protein [Streptomyces phage BRock]
MYYALTDLENLVLDDADLEDIQAVVLARAAQGSVSVDYFVNVLHDLNVYGVKHELGYGSTLTGRINEKENI